MQDMSPRMQQERTVSELIFRVANIKLVTTVSQSIFLLHENPLSYNMGVDRPRSADNVTQLAGSKTHAVFRLRQEEDTAPWVTEMVCYLFNAQGNVLQVARGPTSHPSQPVRTMKSSSASSNGGYFGDQNLLIRRAIAKEAVEKEILRFSLERLNASVEVVGIVISYSEDAIARRPNLNAFSLTCDLCATPTLDEVSDIQDSDFGRDILNSYSTKTSSRVLSYVHDKKVTSNTAYVISCKFFRDRRSRECMQVFLLDIIPEIEIPNRNGLTSVASICAALSCDEFLGIEHYFPDSGLQKPQFARIILYSLLLARPELRHMGRATAIVALLFELFEQIDINGDAIVDWDEFTTFCISLGLIATHDAAAFGSDGPNNGSPGSTGNSAVALYQQQAPSGEIRSRPFPYQIAKIRSLPLLKRVALIENKSHLILMCDTELALLHEFNCCEKLGIPIGSCDAVDIDHVPSRNSLAVATSDSSISLWSIVNAATGAYVLALKLTSRYPPHSIKWCPMARKLFVSGAKSAHLWDLEAQRATTHLQQVQNVRDERVSDVIEVSGSPPTFATSSLDHSISVWEFSMLDSTGGSTTATEESCGEPRITFTLLDHVQAALSLDYLEPILLSSGFEFEAYCWNIPTQSLRAKLTGHHHSLIGAKFVTSSLPSFGGNSGGIQLNSVSLIAAVTGDRSGHFKLWDVTRLVRGYSTDLVSILQAFDIHSSNSSCGFSTFAVVPVTQLSNTTINGNTSDGNARSPAPNGNTSLCDIVSGNLRLLRFRAIAQTEERQPPRFVVYNSVTNGFVGVVGCNVAVWNGNSGEKLEEPVTVRDAEICGIAFDEPRERKLFVATNDGAIRLYNPVTGTLLMKTQIHDGIISSLLFCPHTNCLISTGYDRSVCVSLSQPGRTDLEILRTVENAHDVSITACAFSTSSFKSNLSPLVATADESGALHVYDFATMYLLFHCVGHRTEVRALHFHCTAPLLISGDAVGTLFIWGTTNSATPSQDNINTYTTHPLMALLLSERSAVPRTPTPSSSHATNIIKEQNSQHSVRSPQQNHRTIITTVCSTEEPHASIFAGDSDGLIHRWDLRALQQVATKRGLNAKHFETQRLPNEAAAIMPRPTPTLHDNSISLGISAHPHAKQHCEKQQLRVNHKLSILRLQGDDRHWFRGLQQVPRTPPPVSAEGDTSHNFPNTIPGCHASCTWAAHSAPVAGMRSVPFPGAIFTYSMDCMVKVWDWDGGCMGLFSTCLAGSNAADAKGFNTATRKADDGQPLAWKFTRHIIGDESARHQKIASEVIRKHQRESQRGIVTTLSSGNTESTLDESYTDPVIEPYQSATISSQPISRVPIVPFSNFSVNAGIQSGLFGPEELARFKALERDNSTLIESLQKKAAQEPTGYLSIEERERLAASRAAANVSTGKGLLPSDSVLRAMKNYPQELQRHRRIGGSRVLRALDITPSSFLVDKLGEDSIFFMNVEETVRRRGPKSTPKFKGGSRGSKRIGLHMEGSVSISRNVSLPALPSKPEATACEAERSGSPTSISQTNDSDDSWADKSHLDTHSSPTKKAGLSYSASAPVISNRSEQERANIERKMKIYEGLALRGEVETSEKGFQQQSAKLVPGAGGLGATVSSKALVSRQQLPSVASMHVESSGSNPFSPYYTVKQVLQFGALVTRFDEDYSGDLDQQEWMNLIQSSGPIFGNADIGKLFRTIDRDDSGKISLREVLPAVFARATPDQLQKMRQLIQSHTQTK